MSHRLTELDEIRADLEVWIEKTAKQMGDSAICMSIFTDDYKKGVDSLLQLSLALMMDKPIYLLVAEGTKIPPKIRKIADGIEFYKDLNDALPASERLLKKAMPDHFKGKQ